MDCSILTENHTLQTEIQIHEFCMP